MFISFIVSFIKYRADRNTIRISGSNTVLHLNQNWAEAYNSIQSKKKVQVTGGGSGLGIASLLWELTDIAAISRKLTELELKQARERDIEPIEIPIAYDAIAIAVHRSNPIDYLNIQEIALIFSGKINNWADLGWKDAKISLYGREISSGTYELFKDFLKNKINNFEFSSSLQTLQGAFAVSQAIAKDPNSIGFSGLGNFFGKDDIKIIGIAKADGDKEQPIYPVLNKSINFSAIINGYYPFSRKIYFYSSKKNYDKIADFLAFIQSDKGKELCLMSEFIPIIKQSNDTLIK